MADWSGRKLGKIQIGDLIARGGMAEVYLGMHETYGEVAVKVLRGLLDSDSNHLTRFKREAEVIGDLKHPYIVQMFDYFVEDETPCLVMEYISGPSLATYMTALHNRKQRIPIAVVAQILRAIASALDYAHSKGLVHRDIKPANVLLRSPSQAITLESTLPIDIEPILTDFGLVRLLGSTMHTTTGSVSGTPAYMSPEQSRGEKVDHRTDLYSLGIMLYEMLAGQVPYQSDTTFGMLMKHINEPLPPIKGLSDDMNILLDRALAKDPSMRYESAGEMASEFMAIFNGQTISPGTLHIAEMARKAAEASKTTPRPTEQPPTRFRWARLGLEIALVLGLAYLIFTFVQRGSTTFTTTPAAVNPDLAVGRVRYDDFSGEIPMDTITLSLNNVQSPAEGKHYEGWLVSNDRKAIRKVGAISLNAANVGQVIFTDRDKNNLFQLYDKVIVTEETNDVEVSQPTGKAVYSSIFPPKALVSLRKLMAPYEITPLHDPLIQGLWYYSADWITLSINGDKDSEIVGLREAFEKGDEATVRNRIEEIINQIVGKESDQFLDYDKNGVIDNTPGEIETDGYGSFPNGTQNGYIQETALQAKLAADAIDSTPNIRDNSAKLQICIQNMGTRLNLMLETALKLNDTTFGPGMEPIIKELETQGKVLMSGEDINGNTLFEAIPGECGADDAYGYSYLMADMLLYPGEARVPPAGK